MNTLSRELEARRARGLPVIDLTVSNPTAVGLALPAGPLLAALDEPRLAEYRPDPAGLLSAREAVVREYARLGAAVRADRVLLTASTSEAYSFLFKLLTDPGDSILVPTPSYPLFDHLAAMEHLRVVRYDLTPESGWSIDLDQLESRIDRRSRAVLLVHPNNPTGSFVKRDEAAGLLELAARHGLAIVSDEVFGDFARRADPARAGSLAAIPLPRVLVFALGGISKSAALPQLKLAWIAGSGPEPALGAAWERLELIADTYLSVGTPVQLALPKLFELAGERRRVLSDRLEENLRCLGSVVASLPSLELLDSEGGWSAIVRIPRTRSEEEWVLELIREEGILVHPGYFFDFPSEAYLVLSLLPDPALFRGAVSRLLTRVDLG